MNSKSILLALALILLIVYIYAEAPTRGEDKIIFSTTANKDAAAPQQDAAASATPVNNVKVAAEQKAAAPEPIVIDEKLKAASKQQEDSTNKASSTPAAPQEKDSKEQQSAAVASNNFDEDDWFDRSVSLLNALTDRLDKTWASPRLRSRRSLFDRFWNDDFGFDSDFDSFLGFRPSSWFRRPFGRMLRRRPAFYWKNYDNEEGHQDHSSSCGCGTKHEKVEEGVKQQQVSSEAATTATTGDAASSKQPVTATDEKKSVKKAEEENPLLTRRVKSEWNEDEKQYKIKVAIPENSYSKDQIKIQIKPSAFNGKEMIEISGENKEKQSSFVKSFVFQKPVDSDKVKAKFEQNGTLTIEVEKKPVVENVKTIAIE